MEKEFLEIKKMLEKSGVDYKLHEHTPTLTSKEAAKVRKMELKQGVKSIIFKSDSEFILVLIRGDKKAEWALLRKALGCKKIRMATPDEVLEISGCEVGSVHPFGFLMNKKIKIYMDSSILENEEVGFSVALSTKSCNMSSEDLKNLTNSEVIEV